MLEPVWRPSRSGQRIVDIGDQPKTDLNTVTAIVPFQCGR
jgi:hypothetical protein